MRPWRRVAIIALPSRAPQPESWPPGLDEFTVQKHIACQRETPLGLAEDESPGVRPLGFRRVARILDRKVQMRLMSASRPSGRKTL
jgi:hypothetical protein